VKIDLKSRSKITGLEMILDQDHFATDLRSYKHIDVIQHNTGKYNSKHGIHLNSSRRF